MNDTDKWIIEALKEDGIELRVSNGWITSDYLVVDNQRVRIQVESTELGKIVSQFISRLTTSPNYQKYMAYILGSKTE